MARFRSWKRMAVTVAMLAVAVAGCSKDLQTHGGSPMAQQIQFPPARTVTALDDGEFTEFYAVNADARRNLSTIQFFEDRPDLGEIRKLKEVSWDMTAPAGAQLFIATSGVLRDKLKAFWIGWRENNTIAACSLFQEDPIKVEVPPGAEYVYPPVVLPNRKLNFYFWQNQGSHRALMLHEFTGDLNEPGRVATAEVLKVSSVPRHTTLAPVSGDDKNRAVLGWIEPQADSMTLVALAMEGGSPRRYETQPLPDLIPLDRQKPAVQWMRNGSVVMMAFARNQKTKAVVIVEVRFNVPEEDKPVVRVHPVELASETISAAAAYCYPDPDEARAFAVFLDVDQRLHVASATGSITYVLHENLPPDYDFPIVASYGGRYEARLDERNNVVLVTID